MAFIGGLFNLVDRATQISAHANSVIDYLHTGNTLSNFPDVFILTGIIGFGVVYIIFMTIYTYSKNKKTKNEKDKS
jgi:lipoprotein signal peptidase